MDGSLKVRIWVVTEARPPSLTMIHTAFACHSPTAHILKLIVDDYLGSWTLKWSPKSYDHLRSLLIWSLDLFMSCQFVLLHEVKISFLNSSSKGGSTSFLNIRNCPSPSLPKRHNSMPDNLYIMGICLIHHECFTSIGARGWWAWNDDTWALVRGVATILDIGGII